MKHSYAFILAFSLLLLGLFATSQTTHITGDLVQPSFSRSAFSEYVSFRAQQDGRLAYAQDKLTIQLPGKPQHCVLEGRWETDNDPILGRQRKYCHKAKGTFTSYIDEEQQYVVTDPDYFHWAGLSKPKINPPSEKYLGKVFHVDTCDSRYYQGPRYSVTGKVLHFSEQLEILWNYFDQDTKPAVDFFFTITCELEKQPSVRFLSPTLETALPALHDTLTKVYYERTPTSSSASPQNTVVYLRLGSLVKKFLTALFV